MESSHFLILRNSNNLIGMAIISCIFNYISYKSVFKVFFLRPDEFTEVFPGTRKMERKEKPPKISCQSPVKHDAI